MACDRAGQGREVFEGELNAVFQSVYLFAFISQYKNK